ncbi:MAG: glycerophosphodiester phosphodiesterase [Victivallales bacterium]
MLKHRNLEELYRKTERTIVTAHRGFSGRYPENTLTAMREAIRAGADIIEFDLRPPPTAFPSCCTTRHWTGLPTRMAARRITL